MGEQLQVFSWPDGKVLKLYNSFITFNTKQLTKSMKLMFSVMFSACIEQDCVSHLVNC